MTLPMSWDEWAQHDGTALAARVRKGELTAVDGGMAKVVNEGVVDGEHVLRVEHVDAAATPNRCASRPARA